MILLTATDQYLYLDCSVADSLHYSVNYADHDATSFTPGSEFGVITASGGTQITQPPASGAYRQIKSMSVRNFGALNTVIIYKFASGAVYLTASIALATGEVLEYQNGLGFRVLDATGAPKVAEPAATAEPVSYPISFYKPGTTAEAAGYHYFFGKDSGAPGAWAPGTPGVGGRSTYWPSNADGGALPLAVPPAGLYNHLTGFSVNASVAQLVWLSDVIIVNSGLSVTSTASQTVNTTGIPDRDQNGTSLGHGILAAILVTTATANAAANSNLTISYTNQDGSTGRTGTMTNPNFPATAAVGTLVFFQLAEGDSGVRSIQSFQNGGLTMVSGAISLVLLRPLACAGVATDGGTANVAIPTGGFELFPGACLLLHGVATNNVASNISGFVTIEVSDVSPQEIISP